VITHEVAHLISIFDGSHKTIIREHLWFEIMSSRRVMKQLNMYQVNRRKIELSTPVAVFGTGKWVY
jgi:hypothetical protein